MSHKLISHPPNMFCVLDCECHTSYAEETTGREVIGQIYSNKSWNCIGTRILMSGTCYRQYLNNPDPFSLRDSSFRLKHDHIQEAISAHSREQQLLQCCDVHA